jgi:hypothetical protein
MKRGDITINNNRVRIIPVNGTVWLSQWQIANLFEVFQSKVSSNIRAILKSGVLWESEVCYCHHYENGNSVDLYNLEMITALVFRIHSRNAEIFRQWLMKRAITPCSRHSFVLTLLADERKINLN